MSRLDIVEQVQGLPLRIEAEALLLHVDPSPGCGSPVKLLESVLKIPGIALLDQIAISFCLEMGEV